MPSHFTYLTPSISLDKILSVVDGVAVMDQLFDSNHNFNNVGPCPNNSPSVVLQSNADHESLRSLLNRKIYCVSWRDPLSLKLNKYYYYYYYCIVVFFVKCCELIVEWFKLTLLLFDEVIRRVCPFTENYISITVIKILTSDGWRVVMCESITSENHSIQILAAVSSTNRCCRSPKLQVLFIYNNSQLFCHSWNNALLLNSPLIIVSIQLSYSFAFKKINFEYGLFKNN